MVELLRHEAEVTSTNDVVAQWLRDGCANGAALYADSQSKGRGRLGRQWFSPDAKNLYLSVAARGHALKRHLPLLPLAAAVACIQALARHGVTGVTIKWPNDLMLNDMKLGGILCEGVTLGNEVIGGVIGIGINVQTGNREAPTELKDRLIGVCDVSDEVPDIAALAGDVRERVVANCEALATHGASAIADAWRRYDGTSGRRLRTADGQVGTATGIGDDGSLKVRLDDGPQIAVRTGEVVFLPPTEA